MATSVTRPRGEERPRAASARRVTPGRVCALVVVVELVVLYVLMAGNGWVFDDNLSLELARQGGFTWHWLSANLFGHFEIAHRAAFSVQLHLMPIDYRWALVAMLLMLGLAAYLLQRSLRMLVGEGWMPWMASVYFGISVLFIASLQWWSSGLETFPTFLCDLLCLWGYLHYEAEPRRRWIVVSAGAMAVGLLFYEKPAYMLLYLVLIRVLLLSDDLRPRAIVAAIWRERAIWLAYVAVIIGYVVLRESSGAGTIASTGSPTLSEWLAFSRIFWAQTLVPSVFGLHLPASGLGGARVAAVVVLQLVVIAAVLVSLRMGRGAWRAWLALGICVLATLIVVGQGRLAGFGAASGADTRYLVDFAWLVPLMVCLAFSRDRVFTPVVSPPGVSTAGRPRTWLTLGVGVLVLAYIGASIAADAKIQSHWQGPAARSWEQNMETGLATVSRSGAHPVIADNDAPWFMVESAFAPYNQLGNLLPVYDAGVQVDGPLKGPLFLIDPSGHLHRARVGSTLATYPSTGPGCVSAGSPLRFVHRISPAPSPIRGPYYLKIWYSTAHPGSVPIYVDRGQGYPAVPDVWMSVAGGSHQSIAWLGDGSPHAFMFALPAGGGMCVTRIDLVTLRDA